MFEKNTIELKIGEIYLKLPRTRDNIDIVINTLQNLKREETKKL